MGKYTPNIESEQANTTLEILPPPAAATLKNTSKLSPITTTKTTVATTTTTTIHNTRFPISSASAPVSPISPTAFSPATSHPSIQQPLSPILMDSIDSLISSSCDEPGVHQGLTEKEGKEALLSTTTAPGGSPVTIVLHKKDSGTSMASAASANYNDDSNVETSGNDTDDDNDDDTENSSNGNATEKTPPSSITTTATTPTTVAAASTRQPAAQQDFTITTPTGRVLTRPLSTSKLSSTPMTAPHILPNLHHTAGFNLATLGQLSPTAAAAASGTMTMSRADTLAFLNSNSNNSYFTVGGSSRTGHHGSDIAGIFAATGAAATGGNHAQHSDNSANLPSGNRTMCGSDAISLLDLEDTHNDIVMIDSNGNSSASGVTGTAVVGETIASASAFVTNRHSAIVQGNGMPPSVGTLGTNGVNASSSTSTSGLSSSSSSPSKPAPRSSLPSLTSQAKRDAMQRAAMIAAMQQNGGAKILAAHRVGRRQDRPSRNIRFGEFHRICEIEYGFEQGKPLIANGRTLIHATRALLLEDQDKREEMLYLFSDVLVTGTKIRNNNSPSQPTSTKVETKIIDDNDGAQTPIADDSKDVSEEKVHDEVNASLKEVEKLDISVTEKSESEQEDLESVKIAIVNNPYAGHLENQQISRLTQVQTDVVEDDERPLLKITTPQVSSTLLFDSKNSRDKFLTLLNDTIVAHKHHLLFQSKYLADLKKFKRHSAFSFDTSFLKTWGIPGGLNLGSIKPTGGNLNGLYNNGVIGPGGTVTSSPSPLVSPGGGAFDPSQYQQYLNRPQSMAGSLFNFALHGGSFPSFSDHSRDNSYATLRGTSAANALQHHQQQQQQMLHNRLSMTPTGSIRPMINRTSSGSTFDAFWFMKGGDHGRSRRSMVDAITAPVSDEDNTNREKSDDMGSVENPPLSPVRSSPPTSNLTNITTSTGNAASSIDNQSTIKQTLSASPISLHPSASQNVSSNPMGTLRNGPGWVRDEDAAVCMVCSTTKFGVLVRKHHCRLCGRVICWKCCQMKDVVLPPETPISSIPNELRKPIRVCLDCIEQDATQEINLPRQQLQHSPLSSSFPLHGVLGKLMSTTSTSPQLYTSPTNVTGSTFIMPQTTQHQQQNHTQMSYPRKPGYGRGGNAYPHRASMYRIDVECVGEEEEEEEEKEEEEERKDVHQREKSAARNSITEAIDLAMDSSLPIQDLHDQAQSVDDTIPKSNQGTLRLKDLDPADINEEEVNHQIMTLESEVESLLIHGSPLMFGGAIDDSSNGNNNSRGGKAGGSAGKTRVLRRIPREFIQAAAELPDGIEIEEDHEEDGSEEKTMEELLAEQDEQMKHILTR
ncbi:Zinc finger FYVE domain-containing protein 26 [Entomortierella lignicola]|nr:Zinc finger FYVE domain-containing protein 26 [Entomortierella lignicola]